MNNEFFCSDSDPPRHYTATIELIFRRNNFEHNVETGRKRNYSRQRLRCRFAALILSHGTIMLFETSGKVMGAVIFRDKIEKIILSTKGVLSVHRIRTRKIGYGYQVDMHIQVEGSITVIEGHNISEEAKARLIQKGPNIVDVIVHLEPQKPE